MPYTIQKQKIMIFILISEPLSNERFSYTLSEVIKMTAAFIIRED